MFPDQFVDLPMGDIFLLLLVLPLLLIFLSYLIYRIRNGEDFDGLLFNREQARDRPATREMVDAIPKRLFSHDRPASEDDPLRAALLSSRHLCHLFGLVRGGR